jgi:2-oxo-4-hydroxy-4-carboxy-5-ureidoimidazoline decarboxylase
MSDVLALWNDLGLEQAAEEILSCCGSRTWAHEMATRRPIVDEASLLAACDEVCQSLTESDWDEAFRSHPRIGESPAPAQGLAKSVAWSGEEQREVGMATDDKRLALAAGNRRYERRFHRIFIVCAGGKSAAEVLENLLRRLGNNENLELLEAAEQQRQIAHIRLKKWLAS